jgi:exonuclease SbcC
MKLLKLELNNFRQYKNSVIDFPSGLLAIIGDNGVGKTTLIEAILFSLFGAKAVRGKTEDLRTRGSQEPLKAILTFELSGTVYRAERSSNDAFLYVGGESVALARGTVAVTERLQKLLKLTREEFTATFFTEQKGLEFLSGKRGAAERERFIIRMMGYDRLESVQELLREDKKILKANSVGYENSLGDRQALLDQMKKEQKELQVVESSLDSQHKTLEKALSDLDKNKKIFDELDKGYKVWVSANQQLMSSEARYSEKVESLSRIELQLKALRDNAENEKIFKLSSANKTLDQVISEHRTNLEQLKSRLAQVVSDKSQVDTQIALLSQNYQADLKRIDVEIARHKVDLKQIEDLISGAACPTCGQPVGESAQKIKNDLEKTISKQQSLKSNIESEYKSAKSELEKSITSNGEDLKVVNKNISEVESILKQLESGLKVEAQRQAFESEINLLREQIKLLDNELKNIRKDRSEIKFSEEAHLSAKAAYVASESMVSVARLQKVELEGEVKTKQALVRKSAEAITLFDEKLQNLTQIREKLISLEEADEVLTAFRKYLNDSIRPALSGLASDFLSELTDGRYTEVFIGADFAPTVFDDGEVKNVISGGETDILNLCLRLALSQFLAERAGQPLSLLILDEVFGSLDQQRRINVLQLLEKLRTRFEQIIIITHMDDTRDSVEHLLEVQYDVSTGHSSIVKTDLYSEGWAA